MNGYSQSEPYRHAQVVLSFASTHMIQSEWQPYQNQPAIAIAYMWYTVDSDLATDIGFSMSTGIYPCANCAGTPQGFDAIVYSLHLGAGKWWRREGASAFITGGLLAAFSEYKEYALIGPNSYNVEYSSRGHGGIYIRSGADFRISKKGLRLGPFLDARLSTGSTKNSLYLNVNSVSFGIYFGIPDKSSDQM